MLPSLGRAFRQSLRGEERWGLAIYNMMPDALDIKLRQTAKGMVMPPAAGPGGAFYRIFLGDVDGYVKLMKDAQEWAVQPYYQSHDQLSEATDGRQRSGLMTRLIAPSVSVAIETLAKVEAADACAHVAVAMTRYRLDQGALPSKLDELVPKYLDAIPVDPFDGHPLRLAVKDNQWIIYSVGPDGVDDGGADLYAASTKGKGDVIFTLKPQHGD
jgi:hypothetical protein